MSAKVEIYTTPTCPYCVRAKKLLHDRGAMFQEIDVSDNDELCDWLHKTTGRQTVPQVFIDDRPVGGYDDIAALDKTGDLARLLRT